ncbi:endo-1,3;1,4-beta-D-glucanase-like isoform X2 [Coffea eugenioides]|uniref:Endo-1,31,4-beta-D-glucanase-like isoform X2 n=1 Tax=Coffea arabica TaxID=13443 RepID=A0A6P6ULR3_COFAR|nr:endo-1,3;1,4-beta-D-glucanase-like isoform X2 [Coffea arabica]XP_027091479.1 endo-1,3;1,4-beta-D-glucanase-like isoform X2 [Coffea arabica]XP_027162510.1 endo-1,3;1,4-beta-D-glucanase-like isoform X2 [Coffea eugenioides]
MSGPQCCENAPSLSSSSGAGHVEEIGGLQSYVTGPADSKIAVLLVSDVFGYEAPKLRKLADKVAGAGIFVVVPDFFFGDPLVLEKTTVDDWLKNHGPDQGFEHAKPVIEALKGKGITKVGAAGFCWGGVKVPISILGAEKDQKWPPELLKKFGEALDAKPEVDGFVKIFPGATHGWTVRYKDEDEKEVKAAAEAHQDTLDWFVKYLK